MSGKDVYADQTSIDKKARKRLIELLLNRPDEINVIWINTSLEQSIKNNSKRSGRSLVPEEVIKQMYYRIEKPKKEEGIDYLIIVENGNKKQQIKLK